MKAFLILVMGIYAFLLGSANSADLSPSAIMPCLAPEYGTAVFCMDRDAIATSTWRFRISHDETNPQGYPYMGHRIYLSNDGPYTAAYWEDPRVTVIQRASGLEYHFKVTSVHWVANSLMCFYARLRDQYDKVLVPYFRIGCRYWGGGLPKYNPGFEDVSLLRGRSLPRDPFQVDLLFRASH
ncbi:MAG: hypothetical protein E5V89_01905 [Mesorhizobium sp.]|nr:MAG: hypothetical protein E5V89_01905 [Mesorhizobium sp.]